MLSVKSVSGSVVKAMRMQGLTNPESTTCQIETQGIHLLLTHSL